MKRLLIALVSTLVIISLFAFPSTVKADVAPPEQPPGTNPEPGSEQTQVRMLAETVLIDVQANAPEKSLGQAQVSADFTMSNLGSQAETMKVRFPISASDGWGNTPEIKNLIVKVGGTAVAVQKTTGKDPNFVNGDPVPWVEFTATFPAGQEVKIQVDYTLEATGLKPYIWFNYIFSTGAGWKGTIGSADLIFRLPYEANNQNVLFDTNPDYIVTSLGGIITGNEIHWTFKDFEPTANDNFKITLVAPSVWQKVLKDQAYVAQYPNDGEGWGILGKQYKELTFSAKGRGFRIFINNDIDEGARALYQLSQQAYEKSVTLKPDDPLWHAGYADLMAFYAYYANQLGYNTTEDALHAMREIKKAIELAPADAQVQNIASEIAYFFPDGMVQNGNSYSYPWLTATPIPPTPTIDILIPVDTATTEITIVKSTAVAQPSETTQVKEPSQTPSSSASKKPIFPFCGSILLIPLGLFLLLRRYYS